jgi:Cys-tRNA(Pro)/Cys-tRNA(Cys) deacylase
VTPAIKLLEEAGAPHEVLSYRHDRSARSYGAEAAEALGLSPDQVFKTLVAIVDGDTHVVAVIPVSASLDLRGLAGAARGKKARMAEPADAERLTGYVVGGISPLGQKRRLAVFIDRSAEVLGRMYVSAGRRGLEVGLSPRDLVAVAHGTFADIASS